MRAAATRMTSHRPAVRIRDGLLVVAALLIAGCSRPDAPEAQPVPGISWSTVFRDHTLASLADRVPPWAASRHFSSASHPDKVSLVSFAPQIFGDMDHGFFLRVTDDAAGVEATLAEVRGPGMITWMWSATPVGTLRLYIDDSTKPALEMPLRDFLRGTFLPDAGPFAARSPSGFNLHVPLIHTNYLRVAVRTPRKEDLAVLYYQIAWNALPPDAKLHAFDAHEIRQGGATLRARAREWEALARGGATAASQAVCVQPGALTNLYASASPGQIEAIVLQAERKSALTNLWLSARWDEDPEAAFDAPLHALAGVSRELEDVASLPVTVRGARVEVRWPMPYARAVLDVRNAGAEPVTLRYTIRSGPPQGVLRFGATWKRITDISTDGGTVLALAGISGAGRIVGHCLQVDSRTPQWWGEGDQLIFLDAIVAPTWRGTGTEDYFGLAWCDRTPFGHPLRGQSRVRDGTAGRLTAMHRYHVLDTLPFQHHARFDTEAWGLTAGRMDYETLVLYYRQAQASAPATVTH